MKKRYLSFILMIVVALIVVGCSSNNNNDNAAPGANNNNDNNNVVEEDGNNNDSGDEEQVTVSMMVHWSEKDFEKTFGQHIKKDLPHINLEYIQANGEEEIEQVFAKGIVPDIHMGSISSAEQFDLIRDQMPLVEEYGLDLDLYEESMVETLKAQSREGELNALPFIKQGYVMTYNKDAFDAFGVPYPEDNMTWDEAIELAKKVSGERDGQQYHGIYPDRHAFLQLSTTLVDPETDEPNILDNQELRLFLERTEAIFNIPGNLPDMDIDELTDYMYNGIGTDTIFDFAMYPSRANANGHTWATAEGGLSFDWASYPVWGGEYPDTTPNELLNALYVTKQSENPEAAFEVIAYLMSEDYQKWAVATGSSTPLVQEGIYDDFGTELEHADLMEDKNKEALFLYESAPTPVKSKYERTSVLETAYRLLLEGEDVNTVLRTMDEELGGIIEEIKGKE